MSYTSDLEVKLGAKEFIDRLEGSFDRSEYSGNFRNSLNLLRKIKLFLYREWDGWRPLSQDSKLDATDCLTLATITNLLAARKGVETIIVRPKDLTRYFHAMLEYDTGEGKQIFKLAGRNRNYETLTMPIEQVERRIRYIRPLVNLANSVRFGNKVPSYAHQ
jgi:hypothetical protein